MILLAAKLVILKYQPLFISLFYLPTEKLAQMKVKE